MKMKNKRSEQIEAKKRHLAEVAANKAKRRAEPSLEREMPAKAEKPTILIVCEGQNTEPSYFRKFKLSSATIKAIGNGCNTTTLVSQAIGLSQKDTYDQVWCVFDKDQFPANDFNEAIAVAIANNLGVAYSNQAFEYWFILHFLDHQGGAMDRGDYDKMINDYARPLGATYDGRGSKLVTEGFFTVLNSIDPFTHRPRVELAIARAERNYNALPKASPATEESSTTVFRLVREILKFV